MQAASARNLRERRGQGVREVEDREENRRSRVSAYLRRRSTGVRPDHQSNGDRGSVRGVEPERKESRRPERDGEEVE